MDKYYIGVDGGGTKTAFCVADLNGKVLSQAVRGGCSYQEIGIQGACECILSGIDECLMNVKLQKSESAGCVIGLPCYGESDISDPIIKDRLEKMLWPIPVHIVNDVEIAWKGALEQGEGIHIVAGTGAIAYGRGANGAAARIGGWNKLFGDEGSCYWLGRQAMSLFSKQADGREKQGALYNIVIHELRLSDSEDFNDVILRDWSPHRDKVASFQQFARQAADEGDMTAAHLYELAAEELTLLVSGLLQLLSFSQKPVRVSCSGGLMNAGNCIIHPIKKAITAIGCEWTVPRHTPLEGALLLAAENFYEGI